jgi:hypothetical protein
MSGLAKSILGRLSRFHTRDADEARAFLSTKDYELDLSRSDARQRYGEPPSQILSRSRCKRPNKPWQACLAHFRRARSVRDSWRETCVHQ